MPVYHIVFPEFGNFQYSPNKVAYCNGPTGIEGIPLRSGEYYSGRWGAWIDYNNKFKYKKLTNYDSLVTRSETGGVTPSYLQNELLASTSSKRVGPISICFNNSGNLIFVYQDNGDSSIGFDGKPMINLIYSGGSGITGWAGSNPMLYNHSDINIPYDPIMTPEYPVFKTGQVICYYTDNSSSNLYARFEKENFRTEYVINTGLTSGYYQSRIETFFKIQPRSPLPFQSTLYAVSDNGNKIRVLASKNYGQFAGDNFNVYVTGYLNDFGITGLLEKSYGKVKRAGAGGSSSGRFFTYDNYEFVDVNILNVTGETQQFNCALKFNPALNSGHNETGYFLYYDAYSDANLNEYATTGFITTLDKAYYFLRGGIYPYSVASYGYTTFKENQYYYTILSLMSTGTLISGTLATGEYLTAINVASGYTYNY